MARKKTPTLTDAEVRVMEVLWKKKEATVTDVLAGLSRLRLAYSTVLTTLRILENKGYVGHKKSGRAFLYYPVLNQKEARRTALAYIVKRFFNNSSELLLLNLLEHEQVTPAEL